MSITGSFIISGGEEKKQIAVVRKQFINLSENFLDSSNPDTIIIRGESSSIGIEEIRDFQKQLSVKPSVQKTKIGIILNANKLTLESQNSLLKTLEEPPENTAIFLLCADGEVLLETILSRCQIIFLPSEIKKTEDEVHNEFEKCFEILEENSLPAKFKLAVGISKDRDSGLKWLETSLVFLHDNLLDDKLNLSDPKKHFSLILEAKKRLKANSNVRLTIENLFLNW